MSASGRPEPSSERSERSGALSFPVVAAGFLLLLALGVTIGVLLHQRYVGYERVAARHVPGDVPLVARWDVEKVSLFEPTRRYLLPLLDGPAETAAAGDAPAETRRRRLARALDLDVGRDLREVVALFGPAPGDWALVLGGSFRDEITPLAIGRVLALEGSPPRETDGGAVVWPGGAALGRALDSAFVLASSEARLRATLPVRPLVPSVPRTGAGSLLVRADDALPVTVTDVLAMLGEVTRVEGTLDWGSPMAAEVTVTYRGAAPHDALERAVRAVERLSAPRPPPPVRIAPVGKGRDDSLALGLTLDQKTLEEVARHLGEHSRKSLGFEPR